MPRRTEELGPILAVNSTQELKSEYLEAILIEAEEPPPSMPPHQLLDAWCDGRSVDLDALLAECDEALS